MSVLKYRRADGTWDIVGNPVTALDEMSDVDVTSTLPGDGDALVWSATAGAWVPGQGGGGEEVVIDATEPTAPEIELWVDINGNVAPPGVDVPTVLDDLLDVDTTTVAPVAGDALVWDGTQWAAASPLPPPEPPPVWGAGFPYQYGPADVQGGVEFDDPAFLLEVRFNSVDLAGAQPIPAGSSWRTDVKLTGATNEVVLIGSAPFTDNAGVWVVPCSVASGDPQGFIVGDPVTLTYTLEAATSSEDLTLTLVDGQSPPQWVESTSWGMWTGTQLEYDALGTYDPKVLYAVVG